MRANLRFKTVFAAAGLLLVPGLASAQDAAQPATTPSATTNIPAPDAVGPRELQNFSLPGTSTKTTDQPTTPAATSPATANSAPEESASPPAAPVRRTASTRQAATLAPSPAQSPPALANPASSAAVTTTATSLPAPAIAAPAAPQQTTDTGAPAASADLSILPWLLAALALAGGTLFLLWRRRPREALAGGAEFDLFVPPEPAPAPAPRPRAPEPQPTPAPPPKLAAPASNGIVASRLRPSLEIGMQPLRCIVEDDQVTIEFEVELFNAGTAPARAVLAEASLLNASAAEGQELAAFFANPAGAGERIDAIAPMKRLAITSQVVAPRSAIQEYDLGGRKSFVPVVAFNALYEGSGGKAQSSIAYLVGRETNSDKLGPLHLDAGKREFRALGARPLPTGVRT